MKTYVALFRGINVGGKNILPMNTLVEILEGLSLHNIKTYIQSGNVVFQSQSEFSIDLSSAIEDEVGFAPEVITLKRSDFEDAIAHCPYLLEEGKNSHFYFCKSEPHLDESKLKHYASDSEQTTLTKSVFYLHAPDGIGRSKLVSNIEKCLNTKATGRNLNTIKAVEKLVLSLD